MTVEILGASATSEHSNAVSLKAALINSAPGLDHAGIKLAIVPQVFAGNREIDCVLVFEDTRSSDDVFFTSNGIPVHSFVACVEVKNHSPDTVRLHGTHLEVQYNGAWHNATAQANAQVWALKNLQQIPYLGKAVRDNTFVQSLVWLRRTPPEAFAAAPHGRTRILCDDLSWKKLIDGFEVNRAQGKVQTLVPAGQDSRMHSYESLIEALTGKVDPTQLDLRRINAMTQKRFDEDSQAYVRRLGSGLLLFRGRAGTGKTFALIQMAIYLARQGKSTRIVTYNHGLISELARSLTIIRDLHKDISPVPHVETRWMLMEMLFDLAFGEDAVKSARELYYDLEARELLFLRALRHQKAFLKEEVPCCASKVAGKKCYCEPKEIKSWAQISRDSQEFAAPYDFLLVDEGQDWSTEHRDLMYDIFGPDRVIVADGVDQFVNKVRCDWDRGDISKNRIVPLRTSRRTKAATCDTIADIARALKVPDWDVVPDPRVTGGRITVLVEPQPRRAIERALALLSEDLVNQPKMQPVDALVCLPHKTATPGSNYCNLFESVREQNQADYWRGYDWETRQNRDYPRRQAALRAVLYQSCRGMEGWTTLCMALDRFYDYVAAKPDIDIDGLRDELKADLGFLFARSAFEEKLAREQRAYALNWLMIPLTRSMDHLVIHLTEANSALGRVLQGIDGDKISWR